MFVVSQDPVDGESEDDAFLIGAVVLATASHLTMITKDIALADTCCARTVAGYDWASRHMDALTARGLPFAIVDDEQPFRFGDGPRVQSLCAFIFPLILDNQERSVLLRVSIVEDDVPLLVSSRALRAMGAVMDLTAETYLFKKIRSKVQMINAGTGHVGFNILGDAKFDVERIQELDWLAFSSSLEEVAFGKMAEDRVVTHIPVCTRGPQNKRNRSETSLIHVNV